VFDAPQILRRLIDQKVEFVVIGGLAMVTHGSAHVTDDLDVCYRRSEPNYRALAAALAPLHPTLRGAPPGLPFRLDHRTISAGLNFTLDSDLGAIDILGEVAGIGSYDTVLAASDAQILCGSEVRVLSIDGLIAAKRAAGRAKDQSHLLELLELKKLREQGT